MTKKPLFFFLLFLLIASTATPVLATKTSRNYSSTQGMIQSSPISMTSQNPSAIVSSTGDYATVNLFSGSTFYENTNLQIPTAPSSPSIESGSVIKQFAGVLSGSLTLNVPTSNDVIYLTISILNSQSVVSVSNSGTSLNWQPRASATNGGSVRVESWYAISTSGSKTISVSFATSTTFAVIAVAIKDANTPNPFDPTSNVPATATGVGTTQTVSVSTFLPNSLLIGCVATQRSTAVTPTTGSGFTSIQRSSQGQLGEGAESKSLSATVVNSAVTYTTSSSVSWAMIGDVIWGCLPSLSVDTSPTNSGNGNSKIGNGLSGYLVSPAYTSETYLPLGTWALDLSAYANSADHMDVHILVADANYKITAIIASGETVVIPTAVGLTVSTYSGLDSTVPAGGHIIVILTNTVGGSNSFSVYYGTLHPTSFSAPTTNATPLLHITTDVYTSVRFTVYGSSSISRLSDLSFYISSPMSLCVKVTNGVVTQMTSSIITLHDFSIYANATATDTSGVSNIMILLQFNSTRPHATYVINLSVN